MISRLLIVVSLWLMASSCAQSPKTLFSVSEDAEVNAESTTLDGESGKLTKTKIIEQIMMRSGLSRMIDQLPEIAKTGFDQSISMLINQEQHEQYGQFRSIYLQAFKPTMIRETMKAYLADQYEVKHFTELLALLKTPLAEKITELEMQSTTAKYRQPMRQSASTIMGQVTPERLALVYQVDKIQHATQSMLDMHMSMMQTMMMNANQTLSSDQQLSESRINYLLEDIHKQSIYPIQQQIFLNIIYTYRVAVDSELKDYIFLYQSDVGRWTSELFKQGWINVSKVLSSELAILMAQQLLRQSARDVRSI